MQEIGHLRFTPIRSGGIYAITLHGWDAEDLVLEGIPHDDYGIVLSTEGGYAGFLPREGPSVRVDDEPARVEFDLAAATELELLVLSGDGSLYSGELAIHLGYADSSAGSVGFLSFRSAPYVLRGLLEKSYTLTIFRPTYSGQIFTAILSGDLDERCRGYLVVTL